MDNEWEKADELAVKYGVTRSEIMREALLTYCALDERAQGGIDGARIFLEQAVRDGQAG